MRQLTVCSKSNSESGSDDNQSRAASKKNLVSVVKRHPERLVPASGPPADIATTGAPVQALLHQTKRLSAASILVHIELEVQSTKVPREPILITEKLT